MSNALLEAMTLKKFCIVSKIPQNTLLIKDKINGMVFNPRSANDMSEKIQTAFKSKNLRTMGNKSFHIIKDKYTIKRILSMYETLVRSLNER
jgi:glycosyltransferase involved in cell wall biosynthesis